MKRAIAIIGGGAAGMSCALWLKHLGFYPILIDKRDRLGGSQNINPFHNTWYLGMYGKTGKEMAGDFCRHIEVESIPTLLGDRVQTITRNGDFKLRTGKHEITVQGIVIATGQRFKREEAIAEIPGSDRLTLSKSVYFNPGIIPITHGQVVAIVGGGDNGLSLATMLADTAKQVHLFVRSEIRAFGSYQQQVFEYIKAGKITLHKPANIHRFELCGDRIDMAFQAGNNSEQELRVDSLCFRLGFTPNAEEIVQLFEKGGVGCLELNPQGYIKTDEFLRTSIPKVYAAGDVTNPRDPCVATAVAAGAIAARSLDEDLQREL
ncbi:NAD(P)/FAD-dependent oxidoreductase [Oscillatoria sp. HE19RPO]|uniref:NAD(P)/FAD-dependent oxidoreductase n=1 Tax=Oscillatoria sp. HE19RPO TaxID=2954806 RepID=UPI0020C44EAE|nr:NAD(P)/FAD-dependent oxidoreductase [Oscillatoria sp. HE19RPO]